MLSSLQKILNYLSETELGHWLCRCSHANALSLCTNIYVWQILFAVTMVLIFWCFSIKITVKCMTEHWEFFRHLAVTINSEVKISFLKTLNYDLKSVILIYDNLECLLTKKLSRKLLILLFQFVAPNFCFLFIHWLVKMSNRWNVLTFLQSYIKILEMCKKKPHFSYSKYF